jgi:hypothetical protein
MGRLTRKLSKHFKTVARIAAPIAFPALAPLMALSSRRSEPPASPDDVATPTSNGGYLPQIVGAIRSARGRARGFVAEEVAPLLEGTPFEIVDTDDEGYFDEEEDFDDEDFDDEEEE